MDSETLARAGQLLLGDEWQRPLARMLGKHHPKGARESLDPRLIQRWASGDRPVPDWVAPALVGMLGQRAGMLKLRAEECTGLAAELKARFDLEPALPAD